MNSLALTVISITPPVAALVEAVGVPPVTGTTVAVAVDVGEAEVDAELAEVDVAADVAAVVAADAVAAVVGTVVAVGTAVDVPEQAANPKTSSIADSASNFL